MSRLYALNVMKDPESFIGDTVHIVVPGLVGSQFWDSFDDTAQLFTMILLLTI